MVSGKWWTVTVLVGSVHDENQPPLATTHHSPLTTTLLIRFQHSQERLLRDFNLADLFHSLLAFGLLGPELALAGDVAAVALGGDVLLHRGDALAGNDPAADGGLQHDLEQVPVDLAAELLDQLSAAALGHGAVHDDGEGIDA